MDKRFKSSIALLIFFLAGVITFLIHSSFLIHTIENLPNVCPLKRYTGLECAFCGMTHAWIYFWHGEWVNALHANRLSILLFVGTPIVLLSLALNPFWSEARAKIAAWSSLGILFGYTLLRNLI